MSDELILLRIGSDQGFTNPGCLVDRATEFCIVTLNNLSLIIAFFLYVRSVSVHMHRVKNAR
jgi:hypothetical protein